ncbi:putative pentatricopeptide repeat-containing protein At5g09950 [Prosopis cineraria]|uniref:putative pentatricopeptide repeat-containing protein At5g09950 n=1 Tax=Prosopis cineraria TaxID=364024 RepID=UPI002410AEA5|nr:putative pentatricopeptide repeat-containing protein At5g09950 [Prosopis cineraria]XP_054797073.1 putative pentatricopeptide repeat-containing protein At5g09950 [Prosopis cineraria]XP_054797074.1 putative pentatricopeptide repeat-containing protein At5g09950 [Prosopis cineraria]XP_054797075.1 putative pentatricopeptide repeat-containing protein At5g09950 [Prosopis cineraria]
MVCFTGPPYPLCCRRLFHNSRHAFHAPAALPILPSDNPLPFNPQDPSHHHVISPAQLSQNQIQLSLASSCISSLNLENYELLVHHYKNSSCLKDAHQLHLQIYKTGFSNDVFLSNTLINIYVRIGKMVSAQKLFNEMPQKNHVSWACLISGYTQNGKPNEACRLFKGMICANYFPNHYAIGSVLRACQKCGPTRLLLGMQIHGLISKSQYASDMFLSNTLMSMYANCLGPIDDARHVFDEIQIKNSVAWNSIISVYCYRGDAVSVFELFSSMQRESITLRPNEYTFGSLVTAAYSLVDCGLSLLAQILARIEKSGFLQDLYVGSALVSGFARLGIIGYAKMIFKQMFERNAVSMNGLMVGLVKQNQGEEAAEVFREMKDLVEINVDSYAVLLSAFPEFSNLKEGKIKGKELHAHLTRSALVDVSVSIGNALVNMYAKCGAIDYACSVFHFIADKDAVSWNSIISGLDQNERFEEAVASFCAMRRSGMVPSNFSVISTLSSCASLGWITLGQQIHGEGFKWGLDLDVSVSNALLALYGETGNLKVCQKIFFLMPEYDQVSWNSLIGALTTSETTVLQAIKCFQEMMQTGWRLNKVTFISVLAAVSSLSLQELSHQIHALILKYSVDNDNAIENALLACYGKCGQMDDCEKIFCRMSDRRDDVSWNSMISGYMHNDILDKAMDLVWFMMQRGQRLDGFTLATVLSACASVATLERGMEVHACAIRACLEFDIVVGSALVDMYAKCGKIDYASRFFELMPLRNIYTWNSMISGYARHGLGEKALKLFSQMKEHDQSPDHVTFVGVLSACSHVGLVDQGFEHFKSMSEVYGLTPRIEHFSCMVDLLGRAGDISKIENLINTMPMDPNVLIWRTVLGACCRNHGRNTELGQRAAKMLMEMEPQSAVNYVLLSNMHAAGGKWEAVADARMAMRKASVKKEAGCSWVTMNDGVHVFVAGDQKHPEKETIYEKLKELTRKIRDAGYVPETKYALFDLDPESKEEILSYHSEKLAVAFVLTRKSDLPIRIMKNLRVCGDCHTAFKYISKIVNRQIILRDSNRFHHFGGGNCSCGDYW